MEKMLYKLTKRATMLTLLYVSAFAQTFPKNCVDELMTIAGKKNFDLTSFSKDLLPEVVKVKAQMKLPIGKPADSKMTDIGMTVGCLKTFPENPAGILTLLKDVGLGAATKAAGAAAKGAVAKSVAADESEDSPEESPVIKKNKASVASGPALKECDAIFNPSKKFCYDGGVYNLCDGMSYNPTTHICSEDVAYRALCNGTQYNPLKQKCKNNVLLTACGGIEYNSATHDCKDNVVLPKCGAAIYDPATQVCKDNTVFLKCAGILYDPRTNYCKDNVIIAFSKCGESLYDPQTHGCQNNVLLPKCGERLYDPIMEICRDNVVVANVKCGGIVYDPRTSGCKDNVLRPKCGAYLYDPAIHVCKDNIVLARCGATEFYNPRTQECRFGGVFEK